jgi:hypothetical protein
VLDVETISLQTLTQVGEFFSLLLITTSFILLALAARRIRVLRSFQVEMFIFGIILFASESPHILSTLGLIDMSSFQVAGLALRSVSVVFLAGLVAFRIRGFLTRK